MLNHFKLIVGASALFVLFALYNMRDRDQTIAALRQIAPLDGYLQRFKESDVETVKTVAHVQRKRKIRVGNATVQKMINAIVEEDADFFPDWYWTATFATLVKTLGNGRRRYPGDYVLQSPSERQKSDSEGWGPMDHHIRQYSLYQTGDPAVNDLLYRMATSKIETTRENNDGYHLKVDVKFSNGGWAVLKPMRFSRYEASRAPTHERHHAEIAAFHLDRLLGYYRVPPTVGRFVNLRTELYPLLPEKLRKTIFTDEDGRTCFYGKCKMCNVSGPVCGTPNNIEASLMYYLPRSGRVDVLNPLFRIPWAKRFSVYPAAACTDGDREMQLTVSWDVSVNKKNTFPEYVLCNNINATHYKGDSHLLELLDVKYFDSLIDNYDRHQYATYRGILNGTIPFLYDNSRGFGNPANDTIMVHFFDRARHCCLIKKSTFLKYLKLFLGPAPLSMFLRESLRSDLAHTVLPDDELAALDRRVIRTVMFICNCLRDARHVHDVIIDDIV